MSEDAKRTEEAPLLPLTAMRSASGEALNARLTEIKELSRRDLEAYRLVQDPAFGDYYLHYAVRHLNLAAGGAEE